MLRLLVERHPPHPEWGFGNGSHWEHFPPFSLCHLVAITLYVMRAAAFVGLQFALPSQSQQLQAVMRVGRRRSYVSLIVLTVAGLTLSQTRRAPTLPGVHRSRCLGRLTGIVYGHRVFSS